MNQEFEKDIIKGIDESGYSEKQTDVQIDKVIGSTIQVKQFNRLTKDNKKKKKNDTKKESVIFKLK